MARVGKPATLFPGAMAVGAGGSHADARTLGRISGAELHALGIRQDYSPDADVNVNPANPVIGVRSFGADPDAVAGLVAAEVKGYQSSGSRRPPSTSRATATPPSTATSASRSSPTAASCGSNSTRCPSGRRSAPGSARS